MTRRLPGLPNTIYSPPQFPFGSGGSPLPPVQAEFSGTPLSGSEPLNVQFTDLSTGRVDTWLWDFGDGEPTSSQQNPLHQYANDGTYTVSLTVTGPAGEDTETKVGYVTVSVAGDDILTPGGGEPGHTPFQRGTGEFVSLEPVCPYFDVMPGEVFTQVTKVGVACTHADGIDYVELRVDGGPVVTKTEREYNPDTNVWEFVATLDPDQWGSPQSVQLAAIIYPINGTTRWVSRNVYVFPSTSSRPTRYCSPSGSDGNNGLSSSSPKRTWESAVRSMGGDSAGQVLCAPGNWIWERDAQGGHLIGDQNSPMVTVKPDPAQGANRDNCTITSAASSGPRFNIHLQDFTINRNVNLNGNSQSGERPHLWLDKVQRGPEGPQAYNIDNFGSGTFSGVYVSNSVILNCHQGMSPRATVIRNTFVAGVYEDALRNCRMFLSCWVDDGDAREQWDWGQPSTGCTGPGGLCQPHCDGLQVAATVTNWDHVLWQDCRVTNFNGQGVYIHTNQEVYPPFGLMENVALLNVSVHGRGGGAPDTFTSRMNETSQHRHYVVMGCTFHRQTSIWQYIQTAITIRGRVKGNCFHGVTEQQAPGTFITPDIDADHSAGRLIWEQNHSVNSPSSSPGTFTTGDPEWAANYYGGAAATGYTVDGSVSGAGSDPTDGPMTIPVTGSGIFLARGTPITFGNLPPTPGGIGSYQQVREYVVWEDTPASSSSIKIWPPVRNTQTVSGSVEYVDYRPASDTAVLAERVTGEFIGHEQQITRPFLEGSFQQARLRPSGAKAVGAFEPV